MLLGSERIIGTYASNEPGPLLIVIAGMHGNEPAGVLALDRVFSDLQKYRPPFKGKVMGIRGNISALMVQQRFVDTDLNRIWDEENIKQVLNHSSGFSP